MLHKWLCFFVAAFLASFLASFLATFKFKFDVQDLTDREKCPACFGVSMCRDIDRVKLDWTDFNSIFNNLFGVKNVYFGQFAGQRVVLKKLATNSEWDAFDAMLRAQGGFDRDFEALIAAELSLNHSVAQAKLRLCPRLDKINELLGGVERGDNRELDEYLWTALKINPEPIVLQILRATADGDWPIPKYFGACGRLAVQEYVGPPLTAFYTEPWIKRAKIASSLLHAANLFTFKSQAFAFYFTDVSPDNVAVNRKDEAIFVDLENLVIVDKRPEDTSDWDTWNHIHTNDIDIACQDCLVFSTSDICEHKASDHNYYAICQHILAAPGAAGSAGFLHDPPEYIIEKYPMLTNLLQQCSETPHSRIDSGTKLAQLLNLILDNIN